MVQRYQRGKVSEAKKVSEPDTNQRFLAAVTYLLGFITGIIFLIFEKKDRYIRFHAYQSTVLFGVWFVVYFLAGLVTGAMPFIIRTIFNFVIFFFLFVPAVVVWILLMFKAFSGEKYKFPYAGEWAEKQLSKQ